MKKKKESRRSHARTSVKWKSFPATGSRIFFFRQQAALVTVRTPARRAFQFDHDSSPTIAHTCSVAGIFVVRNSKLFAR